MTFKYLTSRKEHFIFIGLKKNFFYGEKKFLEKEKKIKNFRLEGIQVF